MKIIKLNISVAILILISILISGCIEEKSSATTNTVQCDNERDTTDNKLTININNASKKCEYLKMHCIGESCSVDNDYISYIYQDDDVYFYFSYKPEILSTDYSLESIQKNFKYFNLRVYFPTKKTTNSFFYYWNFNPIYSLNNFSSDGIKLRLTKFEDGKLHGKIEGNINKITEEIHKNSSGCVTDDVAGVCYESETTDIDFTINFSIVLDTNTSNSH